MNNLATILIFAALVCLLLASFEAIVVRGVRLPMLAAACLVGVLLVNRGVLS